MTPDERAALYAEMDASPGDFTPNEWALRRALVAELRQARADLAAAQQEVERLRESESESESVRAKMADLLSRTAIALNGPEPELTMWSWHDLPEKADAALRAIAAVRDDATVEAMAEAISENACSHVYPQWDDCHECEAVARAAHAAALARLDAAQGES